MTYLLYTRRACQSEGRERLEPFYPLVDSVDKKEHYRDIRTTKTAFDGLSTIFCTLPHLRPVLRLWSISSARLICTTAFNDFFKHRPDAKAYPFPLLDVDLQARAASQIRTMKQGESQTFASFIPKFEQDSRSAAPRQSFVAATSSP
ncbi:hypothetical protein XA68_10262 [Ophiocordyceps unilateralis]|uniref:Uncharacterized protein n=1 Tax=Ophiocordyceps unilateralis TaxID=268505 RepID=A0A2A9P2P1_OPHUN|nr:hypothetical protein XA68_10262 [Ophiocordyceps unilateralis]